MNCDERQLLEEKYGGLRNTHFDEDCERLARGEPLAYIIGWQPFLGLKIYLDSKPLIPRPETEWWVERLINEISAAISEASASAKSDRAEEKLVVGLGLAARSATNFSSGRERPIRILDLCAGSGAIGCALLKHTSTAHVYFGEIDPAHEATILKNIRENNLDESRAHIYIGDLCEPFSAKGGPASGGGDTKFDVVAVNPPYIPTGRELPPSVTDYEPALALYSGPDGLDLIRRIAANLSKHLTEGGQAWIECDTVTTDTVRDLFIQQGLNAEIRTDQYNEPRVIVVSLR